MRRRDRTYDTHHQLSHDRFIEVFGPRIDSHGYQVSAINMFLLETPFPLLYPGHSLLLQLPGLPLLLGLPSFRHFIMGT